MNITFGLSLDGYDALSCRQVVNQKTCGPAGLIELLETRLGLKAKRPSAAQRVAQYMRLLERLAGERPVFFSASLRKDAFAVAETLLGWRDGLVEAGWDGTAAPGDSARLYDLARVEATARGQLDPGMADRLDFILKELEVRSPGIDSLVVVEDRAHLPTLCQKLCDKLGAQYRNLTFPENPALAGIDLARIARALKPADGKDTTKLALRQDGSVLRLTAFSELTLARGVAQIIASHRRSNLTQTLIAGQSAAVLDQALVAGDEPSLGLKPRSLARPIPQVLGLALQLCWRPLDPRFVLEFLTHPACPVPSLLRKPLARAMAESPGIGGPKWNEAIREASESATRVNKADPETLKKNLKGIQQALDEWLLVSRFDPAAGAKGTDLVPCCMRVAAWAAARASLERIDPNEREQYQCLAALASEVGTLIKPMAQVTRSELDRILQETSFPGWSGGTLGAQKGHVHRVSNPAALMEPADVVIWWAFGEPAALPRLHWTQSEFEQLAAHGAHFVSPEAAAARERAAWLRPIFAARKQLILVTPRTLEGEPVSAHPLYARLLALVGKEEVIPAIDLDNVVSAGQPLKPFEFRAIPHRPLPGLRRWWKLSSATCLQPRPEESYSSLEKYIYSPYAWVLRYQAHLKAGPVVDLRMQEGSRQNGNLLHRLLDLFLESPEKFAWQKATQTQLDAWIESVWGTLLEQEGANLLLPGKQADAAALMSTAKASLGQLLEQLRQAQVVSASSNQPQPCAPFESGSLGGILDLVVTTKLGRVAVVDLKYGGAAVREKELKENRPLQLAIYGYLWQGSHGGTWPSTAFYILKDQSLVAQDRVFFPGADVVAPQGVPAGIQGCWRDFLNVWRWRSQQLKEGWIELTLKETQNLAGGQNMPSSDPPCLAWAPSKDQDKYNDYDALTGWRANA